MRLLIEDLNNKGNTTNLNHDEETEQTIPPIINYIQQSNNPNKVSQTVINPIINLSNSFSVLNEESDRHAVGSEAENKYSTTGQSTQAIGKTI